MPLSINRRDFLAAGAALAAGDLAAFPRLDGRPVGSLVPITTPEVLPIPAGAFRRLGRGEARMPGDIRGFRTNAASSVLVSATAEEIWAWDVAKRRVLGRFKYPAQAPKEGHITTAGTLLTYGKDDKGGMHWFKEYALPGGELTASCRLDRLDSYDGLCVSDDGKHILVGRTGTVTLFRLDGAKKVWATDVSNHRLGGLNFVGGADWVTVSVDNTVKLLHTADGSEVAEFKEAVAPPKDKDEVTIERDGNPVLVHVSPKGDWLAAVREGDPGAMIAVWDLATRKKRLQTAFRGKVVYIPATGKAMLVLSDHTLGAFDVAAGKITRSVPLPRSSEFGAVAGGRALVTEAGDTLTLLDTTSGADMPGNPDPPDLPCHLEFRGPHRLVGRLKTWGGWAEWDMKTGAAKLHRPAAAVGMEPIALAADNARLVYRDDKSYFQFHADGTHRTMTPAGVRDSEDFLTRDIYGTDGAAGVIVYEAGTELVRHDFASGDRRTLRKVADTRMWDNRAASWRHIMAISVTNANRTQTTVEVWDIAAGVRRWAFEMTDLPRHTAVGPGGALIALVGHDTTATDAKSGEAPTVLRVLSTVTGKEVIRARLPNDGSHYYFSPDGRSLACHHAEVAPTLPDKASLPAPRTATPSLHIWDLHGAGVRQMVPMETVHAAAFSPDGKTLATAVPGGPVFLWDLFALPANAREPDDAATLKAWESLAGSKCDEAFAAVRLLAAHPALAVPLLKEKLPPAVGPDAARVKALLAELDHDQYRRREVASRELAALGQPVRAIVRDELLRPMSQERRTRLERLAEIEDQKTPADLRAVRAVEIAEVAATPSADELLKHWATGFAGAVLTIEAKAALGRRAAG